MAPRHPGVAFNIGSISIYPSEPAVGPEGGNLPPALGARIGARQGGGRPLNPSMKQTMEAGFGHNFADVHVHADGEADALARSLSARAFTLGSDIFLGREAAGIRPHGADALMAHKLTHVVQQRGTGRGGPMTADPVDAPGEREASAVARDVSTGNAPTAQTQPATSNHATVQRVATVPDAPTASAAPTTPADIAARSAFNPMDITHKLLRAIDQSHTTVVGLESHGWSGAQPILKRHVDVAETVAALDHLTAAQVVVVKDAYHAHEHRDLETDLFRLGESGYPTDLTEDQSAQIRALLGGTHADASASAEERQAATTRDASAKAAELHALLTGDLGHEEIERVMGILRQDATANAALIAAYGSLGEDRDLRRDTLRMGPLEGQRAWKLLDGNIVGADAFKVFLERSRIEGIDKRIAKLLDDMKENPLNAMGAHVEIEDLKKERKKLVEDIEERAAQAGADARAAVHGDAHAADVAAKERVAAVLGDADTLATTVKGADAAVIRGIAADDPVPKAAAQLHKAAQSDDLKAEMLTATLRGLRTEAGERAQRAFPKGDPRIESETKRRADDYFTRLRDAYNSLVSGDEKKFGDLIHELGDEEDQTVNIALMQQHGKLDDVTEIVLALGGDRKDTATVERVLRDKNAGQIEQIKKEYQERTHRSLDQDLFGVGATHSGQENQSNESVEFKSTGYGSGLVNVDQGKASGTSRLNLEDYMQRPGTEGGPQEAAYILDRAEREYAYTIDNRGATGAVRDAIGNEERDLLDESIGEVRRRFIEYCTLVGWTDAWAFAMNNLAIPASVFAEGAIHLMAPQMVQSQQAQALIVQMRMARATIRGDRDAYEKATAALRAIFEAIAVVVIQAALTALLSPAAAAALEALEIGADAAEAVMLTERLAKFAASTTVNVAATIGANLAVHGSEYSVAMLKADLLGGLGGSIGGEAIEKMLGPVAKGLVDKLGPKASQELIGLAKTAGSIEGGAWAQGEAGDLSLQNLIKTHIIGKAAGALTHATGKVTGLAPDPGPQKAATHEEHAAPQTTEPVPQENGSGDSGGAGSPQPSGGVPSGGNDEHGMVIHSIPSADGVAEHDLRNVSDAEIDTFVQGMDPDASSPHYQGSVRSDTYFELPAGQDQPGMVPVPLPPGAQGPVQMVPGMVPGPAGLQPPVAFTYGNPNNPNAIQYHEEMSFRGVTQARIANQSDVFPAQTNEAGQPTTAAGEYTVPKARGAQPAALGQANTTGSVIPDTTPNVVTAQVPVSPANSPYAGQPLPVDVRAHSENLGMRQPTEPLPEGTSGPLQANPNYNPDAYSANNPTAQVNTGRRRTNKNEYLLPDGTWTKIRAATPQQRADAHWPIGGTNLPPEAVPPGNDGGAPPRGGPGPGHTGGGGGRGGSFFTPEEVAAAVEGIRPVEEGGTARSGTRARGPADEMTEQMIETVRELSRLNDEVRRLVRGEGTTPLPAVERSNQEIERVQQLLRDPKATPQEQLEAVRTLIRRAVAEFRANQQMGTKDSGEAYTLTAGDLRGMCGGGRDISAEAIISLVGASPHEIRIERIQASHLGINARHGFLVVTLADGSRFLVDPTFAQFADQIGGETYRAGPMLSSVEGGTLARDLLRDGMVPLTDDALRQYLIGLGAEPAVVDAATARLMSGGATLLTEIVRNGEVERFPGRPAEAYNHVGTVSDPAVSPLSALTSALDGKMENGKLAVQPLPPDHPLRPLLESFRARLEALAATLPPLPEPPHGTP